MIKIVEKSGKVSHEFDSILEAQKWLMEGIYGCEGSEQSRYIVALGDLMEGKTILSLGY